MPATKHIQLFNLIAPIYSLFFGRQVRTYRRVISQHPEVFPGSPLQVLDVGCGTGALVYVLAEKGHQVTGVDGSPSMIRLARRLNRRHAVDFQVGDVLDLFDPAGNLAAYVAHYDLVVASYVLHGLQKEQRMALYGAMKLIARRRVVIMDYNQRPGVLTTLIERLEQSDYVNFIHSIETEMRESFPRVFTVQTGKRSAWYVCECEHRP